MLDRFGIGLWTLQSSATRPANGTALYRRFADDALLAEGLGFHSVWAGEHRLWYDGLCPELLHAQAFAAGRTTRSGSAGDARRTQHDPEGYGRNAETLDELSGGRLELGAGLGYRDAEFDALGLRRDRRGRLLEAVLDAVERVGARLWLGGMATPTLARAARRGAGLMLPQTLTRGAAAMVEEYRSLGGRGRSEYARGLDLDEAGGADAERVATHYSRRPAPGGRSRARRVPAPEQLERQRSRMLARDRRNGGGGGERLSEDVDAGVELLCLRVAFEFASQARCASSCTGSPRRSRRSSQGRPAEVPARAAGAGIARRRRPRRRGGHREGLDGVLLSATEALPAPLVAAAALAARVPDVRIAVEALVGDRHPLEVAEEAAIMDVESGGRVILVARRRRGARTLRRGARPAAALLRGRAVPLRGRALARPGEPRAERPQPGAPHPDASVPRAARLELWTAGAGRADGIARGLGHLADAGDPWQPDASPAALGAPRARRDRWDDPQSLLARLRAGREEFAQDWAAVSAPLEAVPDLGAIVRPRIQIDRLPDGLEAFWDEHQPWRLARD